jgi:3-oxoadipate enol-lactonase
MDLRPDLSRIKAPTLVVSGSDDPSTPPEHQRVIAEAIPGARHETVSPAAHLGAVEQPEAINELILEHLS